MSFGSYQQFCEQQRHTSAAAAAGAGDAGFNFDVQLPSHYQPVGNISSPRPPPTNFYGAAPGASTKPPHASQLPSSFFTGQDTTSQPLPGNSYSSRINAVFFTEFNDTDGVNGRMHSQYIACCPRTQSVASICREN